MSLNAEAKTPDSPPSSRSWLRFSLIVSLGMFSLVSHATSTQPAFSSKGLSKASDAGLADLELVRARQRMEKRALLEQSIALEAEEQERFWSLYYDYQRALIALQDEKYADIERYGAQYPQITAKEADAFVLGLIDTDEKKNRLLRLYYRKLSLALNSEIAARFVQIERAWEGSFDLNIEDKIPLIPKLQR
jgi:hypothetical protein